MQPRKKPLKSPFVVTISVAAAASFAVACGGKIPSDGIGNSSGGSSSGSSGSSGTSGGVNPPAPNGSCGPTTKAGDYCVQTEAGCVDQTTGQPLYCDSGVWIGEPVTSNPPPPPTLCPDAAPTEGSSCNGYGGEPCLYVDGCDARPDTAPKDKSFTCFGGAWKRTSPTYPAACPAAAPNSGDSCAPCAGSYPANCTYPQSNGCPGPVVTCDPNTLTWNVGASSCNPPAPPPADAGAGGM